MTPTVPCRARLAAPVLPLALACAVALSAAGPPQSPSPQARGVAFLPGYETKAPQDGGTFARPLPADPSTLNPVLAADRVAYLVYKWVFDPLIDMDQDQRWVGVLAEKWETSPDNRVTTFHLRKGVKWHDGKPFTADDVLFTYGAGTDESVDAITMRSSFDKVAKVEKVDDFTVKVTWKEPFAPGLASWNFQIIPKHVYSYARGQGGAFNKHPKNDAPVGTGPFTFVEWKRGERIVLKANPAYFAGRPHLDQVVFKIIPQSQTLMAAYQTGQLDLTSISAEQWKQLRNDPAFQKGASIFEFTTRQFHYIGWNMDGSNPFFADRRVRQAMTCATNRQGVVDKVLDGHGALASGPFSLGGWEANPKVAPYPYDPAKAATLLDAAGWKDANGDGIREKDGKPFSFECLVPAEAEMYARWLEIFQQDLKRIGVDLKIRKLEYSVFLDRTHRHQFQAFLVGFGLGDDPDPFTLLHSSQAKLLASGVGEGNNDVSFKSPEVDKLIEQEERTFDPKARQAVFWRLHEIIADEQPHTYILVDTQMAAVKNKFQNVRVSRAGYGLFTWYPSLIQWWVPKELQK
jgi:peptide/nickel transport system substrate-binding protein